MSTEFLTLVGPWEDYVEIMQLLGAEDNVNLMLPPPFKDRYQSARDLFASKKEWYNAETGTWHSPVVREKNFSDACNAVMIHVTPRKKVNARFLMLIVERSHMVLVNTLCLLFAGTKTFEAVYSLGRNDTKDYKPYILFST